MKKLLIAVLLFILSLQPAYAQTTFGSIVNLSQNSGGSSNAQVATLGNNVYAVWTDNTPGNFQIFFKKSTDDGATFGPAQQLTSTPTTHKVTPSIAVVQVGGNTHVYITYTEGLFVGICLDCEVRLLRSTNDGASFEAPVNISNTPGSGSGDSHVAAAGNFVFVAWGEFPPPGFPNSEIFLRRSIDAGVNFEPSQQISFTGFFSFTPRIALNLPNVHIVWGDNDGGFVGVGGLGETLYKRSTNNGASFDPVVNLSNNIDFSLGGDIAVSGSNIHVVWAEHTLSNVPTKVVYKRSTNNGDNFDATTTLFLPSGFGSQTLFTGIGATGTDVFVVFSDKSSGNEEILFMESNNNGGTFSSAVNISNNSGVSQFPDIAVSDLSSVHVTWHDNTPTNFDIFYTTSTVPVIEVQIDIKPGSFPNSINPGSLGKIPVAILTTGSFDATTVNPTTVLFGVTGTVAAPVHAGLEDVDGDGDIDMILHFNTQATGIQCGDTSASLTGETFSGQMIQGSDSVKTAGCK